jgi:predicted nucleotidyltransferase
MPKQRIVDTLDQVVETLPAHEGELRASGVHSLSIFGSVARREARPDSDVDLAVRLKPRAHLGLRFFHLEEKLADLLGRPVQLLLEPTERARMQEHLDRDRRLVF